MKRLLVAAAAALMVMVSAVIHTFGTAAQMVGRSRFAAALSPASHSAVKSAHQLAREARTVTSQRHGTAFTTRKLAAVSDDVISLPIAQSNVRLLTHRQDRQGLVSPVMAR